MLKNVNEYTNTLEEYGYACGRIRYLEKYLLNKEIIHKMIESPDLEKSLRVLAESNLNEYSFGKLDSDSIEKVLVNISKRNLNSMSKISPYPYLFQLFSWKYDFHNIKVLLKTKMLRKEEPFTLYDDLGNLGLDRLRAAVFEGEYQLIPIKIERFIKQAEAEYLKSDSLQLMEVLIDKGYYETIFEQLENINQDFLFYYYKTEVDLLNLIISCRCKIRDIYKLRLAKILIKYGHLPAQKLVDIYDNPLYSWPSNFEKSDYFMIIEQGIKQWIEKNSLLKFEQLIDNYLLSLLKIGKYTTFGLECVIGYYYAKENDLKNIKIIINGKKNSLPDTIIKKYIRDTYV